MATKKFILFAALLLIPITSIAQAPAAVPNAVMNESPDRTLKGFVAGGYIYNARENDHGAWLEIGGRLRRAEAAMGFSRMSDPFSFRELQAMGRFHLSRTLALESGYAWGAICNPAECGGSWNNVRTRTPVAGIMYHQRISRSLESVVRMDVVRWQLKPTEGKDDGVRIYVGLRLSH
jgi:hypothetical protein